MRFHIGGYFAALGIAATNTDMPWITDPIVLTRNGHPILTDPMDLRLAFHVAASATDSRFDSPSLASPSRMHVWPVQRSATIPSRPVGLRLIDPPLHLPINEEIALQGSNNLGAATENSFGVITIFPPDWKFYEQPSTPLNPQGPGEIVMKATASPTLTVGTYSAAAALTFAENLKGGWYAMRGCAVQCTNGIFFRFIWPRQMVGAKRPWRSGSLCNQALGDMPEEYQWFTGLGDWGYFSAFEPPLIEVVGNTAGAQTANIFLDLAYIGPNQPSFIL